MASVAIISLTPQLRDLVQDLVNITGHEALPVGDVVHPQANEFGMCGDVLMLDASLPAHLVDSWISRAADVRATVVYFASMLSEAELHAFAERRNAPAYALPNGPHLLARVLGAALVARAARDGLDDRVGAVSHGAYRSPQAMVSELLVIKAKRVIQEAIATRESNRSLRSERDTLLAAMSGRRAELHDAIVTYAGTLRRSGTPVEHTMLLARDALARASGRTLPSEPLTPDREIDSWVLEAYQAA